MTRLEPYYRDAPAGIVIDIASVDCPSLEERAATADGLVLVVGTVSHAAATKVRLVARRRDIPLRSAMGPGVSRVRAAIATAYLDARASA
ncbi:MAG: hypothetical protein KIT84_32175 [Labilithrix sp.]|nr:hypothetical protein [Labilithrix sp.]MCW5815730.1 hypothetical protein [Labilithrix sp.]